MESIITPIILSYVQKYVNLRPQDAQISLWEGDIAFQNLDVRLDVLQGELQLPLEFLSGHIQELIIHIPWTRMTTEPVVITINTIEFVLQRKQIYAPKAKIEITKEAITQEDSSKSYINLFVEKVVNNVSIACNNIILKYVEEDIVVSMNIQLLSCFATNNNWMESFVENTKTDLKRIIRISDLTICLDKRNSAGQIEICQEPVLYKCSLESRLVFQNSATTPQRWTLTQFQTYTKSLELNISSFQFPMLMRLVLVLTDLKKGRDANEPDMPDDFGNLQDETNSESMLSWAWSKVPSIFPEEDAEQGITCPDINLTVGVYISNIMVTLKSMDIIMEGIVNTSRKVRYNPIIRLSLKETYAEMLPFAFGGHNVRVGVSKAFVEELDCSHILFSAGNEAQGTYLQGSLFDQQFTFSKQQTEFLDIEKHQKKFDEKLLLTRTPALALDIVYYTDFAKSNQDAVCDSDINQDVLARLFISTLIFKINACAYKKMNVLQDMCKSYDYPHDEERQPDISNSIPKKTIKVVVANLKVEMHPLIEEQLLSNLNKNGIEMPYMVVLIHCLNAHCSNSVFENQLYPPNLDETKNVQVNSNMLYICDFGIESTSVCLCYDGKNVTLVNSEKLACFFELKVTENTLDDETYSMQVLWKVRKIFLKFSRAEEITFMKLSKTLYEYNRRAVSDLHLSNSKKEIGDQRTTRAHIELCNISGSYEKYKTVVVVDGMIEIFKVFLAYAKVENGEVQTGISLIFEAPNFNKHDVMIESADSTDIFLKCKFQLPYNSESQEFGSIVHLNISTSIFIMDPRLETILVYQDSVTFDKSVLDMPPLGIDVRASSSCAISDRNTRRSIRPDETVHISSEKDLKNETVKKSFFPFSQKNSENNIFPLVSNLSLKLEIHHCDIMLPGKKFDNIWYLTPAKDCQNPTDYFLIRLPYVKCKSYSNVDDVLEKKLPIKTNVNFNSDVTKITWSCDFLDAAAWFYHHGKYEFALNPVKTIVTAVFEQKSNLIFAVNFHLDTSPIIINIGDNQIFFLKTTTSLMCLCFGVIFQSGQFKPKSPAIFEESVQIREFLTLDSNSDLSTEVNSNQTADKTGRNRSTPIWLQWTLTKITVNLKLQPKLKMVFDFEDLTASVDQQNVYFKLKSKIGAFSVQSFSLHENEEWLINDDLKLGVQTQHPGNDRQSAFVDLTVTTAEIQNIFKKWGTKSQSEKSTLSEIMLNLKAFELHLSTKGIENVLRLTKLLVNSGCQNVRPQKHDKTIVATSVSDLPLLHFDCKGFIIYLPIEETETYHNVKQIRIQPKVANPLSRKPLRPDLYNKAEQLRILQTPGSKIEDRQYELIVTNISLATTVWENFQLAMEGYSDTYNKNPAFEWNNIDKQPVVTVNELFRDFTISVIFAPSIMYGSVLVCGQSVEVNCLTDLYMNVSLEQAKLFQTAWQTVKKCIDVYISGEGSQSPNKPNPDCVSVAMGDLAYEKGKTTCEKNDTYKENYGITSKENQNLHTQFEHKSKNDSGFASIERLIKNDYLTPYDVSVVAGVFVFHFYDEKSDCNTLNHLPLLSITLKQPSMLITQTLNSHEIRYSVFDLVIKSDVSGNREALFETTIGNINRAGVALPLISIVIKKTNSALLFTQILVEQPLRFHICENTLKVIFNVFAKVKNILTEEENVVSCKPIHKKSSIYTMRNSLLIDADNCLISFHEIHFEFVFGKSQGLKICVNQMVSEANYTCQPDSLHFKLNLESIFVHTFQRFILHPLSLGCSLLIKQEQWLKIPVFICKIEADTFKIDIGPEQILDIIDICQNAKIRFQESFQETLTDVSFKEDSRKIDVRSETMLESYHLPKPIKNTSSFRPVEYFQDDLRAGAFQIIEDESSANSSMPLPYQMKISSAFRTISWRYPEPRCLKKLITYPIVTEISGLESILCSLEYYNDAMLSFVFCFEFQLSESEYQSFQLPDTKVPAYVWRLVMKKNVTNQSERKDIQLICTENSTTDNSETNFDHSHFFHPKSLIGSICIDSAYEPHKIPVIQIVSNISHLEINFKNQFQIERFQLPAALKDFSLVNNIPKNQTFLSLVMPNVCLFTAKTSENPYSVDFNFEMTIRILDYSYLSNLQFLEPTTVNGTLAVGNQFKLKIIASALNLNIGPTILHTISVSRDLWLQILDKDHKFIPILTRFIICNSTNLTFHFGQINSSESISLQPGECSFYAFCSEDHEQQIIFIFENESRPQICSLDVENEGVYYLNTGNYVVIVEVKNISSTQMYICVKGQLEILSQSKESFEVQTPFSNTKRFNLSSYGHKSFVGDYLEDIKHTIRLRLRGEKMWSGEVPLESKKIPWLVKIPSTVRQYISYWVEIVVEHVTGAKICQPPFKRILVIIWPMFVLRSQLHCDINVTDMDGKVNYLLSGRGQETEIKVAGSNTSEHFFEFQNVSFSSRNGDNRLALGYRGNNIVYKNKYTISGIEKYLANLKSSAVTCWPSVKYDEIRFLESMPPSVEKELFCTYRFTLMRDYSPTLMFEIAPYCLFANETGNMVKIVNITNYENVVVESNRITALNFIQEAFLLYIFRGTHWIESKAINVSEHHFKNSEAEEKIMQSESCIEHIEIYHGSTVSQYILSSHMENKILLYKLSPAFLIVNFTDNALNFTPFSCEESTILESKLKKQIRHFRFAVKNTELAVRSSGLQIDEFFHIASENKRKKRNNNSRRYISFLGQPNTEPSVPLMIDKCFKRICFNIIKENDSVPLIASIVEKNSQFIMTVFNDKYPAFKIENQTNLTLYVASPKSIGEKSKMSISNSNECNFKWYQKIYPNAIIFYTPPEMYEGFPDTEVEHSRLALVLADAGNNGDIKWSKPYNMEVGNETLLYVPPYGDVKISVCNEHKMPTISISQITQGIEFSVKELRTRLTCRNKFNTEIYVDEEKKFASGINANSHKLQRNEDINISCNTCSISPLKNRSYYLTMFFKEIRINLFFDVRRELHSKQDILSIYIDEAALRYDEHDSMISLIISNLQVDNRLFSSGQYDFPVIFCAEETYSQRPTIPAIPILDECINSLKLNSFLECTICFYKDDYYVKNIHCKICPTRTYVEDKYVNDLLEYLAACEFLNLAPIYEEQSRETHIANGYVMVPSSVVNEGHYFSGTLYLQTLKIEPIRLILSVHTCARLYIALDHSSLCFSAYEKHNIYTHPSKLGHSIGLHYLSGALFGAGWVVGSLEILGSPGGLARSVSTGLKDFVSMPVQGLFRGPWGFVSGITEGSVSLLRNVTAGTVNSVSKLAGSVARNLDRLTLDDDHFQRTEAMRRSQPHGVTAGFSRGLAGLGINLLGAIGGLARHPLEAKTSIQVALGVAKGIVGAIAKPLSGAAELLALTGQGVLHTVGFNIMPQQRLSTSKIKATFSGEGKLLWKQVPKFSFISTSQLLFYQEAALVLSDHLQHVYIALTPMVLVILEQTNHSAIEVIPTDRLEVSFDDSDCNLLQIQVLQCRSSQEETDETFFNFRMISYLRDSSDNLQLPSDGPVLKSSLAEVKLKFYIDELLGKNLVRYLKLLRNDNNFLNNFTCH